MSRAGAAFPPFAQTFHADTGIESHRVHFFGGGGEKKVDAELLEGVAVGFEGEGVLLQIFVGTEMLGFEENREDYRRTLALGFADQREMALVQCTHGGDKAK